MDTELDLLGPCNYSCWYCIGDGPPNRYPIPILHDLGRLEEIYAGIGEHHTVLRARGTEPALHPQIADIARICTRTGSLLILTNLSIPVSSWLRSPEGLELLVTIHPEAETDEAGFLERIRQALADGYNLRVQMISNDAQPEWREKIRAAGVAGPLKVCYTRTNTIHAESSRQEPAARPGSLCSAGYTSCLVAYGPGSKSGQTCLYRCSVRAAILPAVLHSPEPCEMPMQDTRCHARVVRDA